MGFCTRPGCGLTGVILASSEVFPLGWVIFLLEQITEVELKEYFLHRRNVDKWSAATHASSIGTVYAARGG